MMRGAASMMVMISILAAGHVDAAAYRWVDDQGRTHYTQTPPPPENVDRGTKVRTTDPATGAREQAQQRSQAVRERLKGFRENRAKAQQEAAEQVAEAERRSTNCIAARANLGKLENRRLRRIADAEGNVTALTEAERQRKMAEARQQIAENCK